MNLVLRRPIVFGVAAVCLSGWLTNAQCEEVPLYRDSVLRFASVEEGQVAISQDDEYLAALTPLDLQLRLKTDRDFSVEKLKELYRGEVVSWSPEEIAKIKPIVENVRKQLEPYKIKLPKEVLLVQTSGREESQAAYTRGAAIFLPRARVAARESSLSGLFTHELFHVISRHNPELRRKIYALLDFARCGPIAIPKELHPRLLSNPDAPTYDYALPITHDDKPIYVIPMLVGKEAVYDPRRGGGVFDYMQLKLLGVELRGDDWQVLEVDGHPLLIDANASKAYLRHMIRNTHYIIHPEEVMADNFSHLVWQKKDLTDQGLVEKLEAVLKEGG